MQYPMTHVLLITSVSMAVLLLVLAALAVMVSWLIKLMPGCEAPRLTGTAKSPPPVAISDAKDLDQIAAVVGVALARARGGQEYSRPWGQTLRVGFNPWRELWRSRTTGYLDRGWRPR